MVAGKLIFESNQNSKAIVKIDKSEVLNQEITRIRINSGKKNKMRPGDILGAISSISTMTGDDIGIIDVQDTCSYVEILGGKGDYVIEQLQETKIKGKVQSIKKVAFRSM